MKRRLEEALCILLTAFMLAAPICLGYSREIKEEQSAAVEEVKKVAAVPYVPVLAELPTVEPNAIEVVEEAAYIELDDIPAEVQQCAYKIGQQYGISQELLEALAFKESSYRADVISSDGACYGLMQIRPNSHKARMERLGVTKEDLLEIEPNMLVAADYLAELFDKYEDVGAVLMAYNGDKRAQAYINGECELSSYAKKILNLAIELEERRGKC